MKKLLLIVLFPLSVWGQAIPGTVVSSHVTTGNSNSLFSIGDTWEMQGTSKQGLDTNAMNAIKPLRRTEGMTFYMTSTKQCFRLIGGIDNTNWTPVIGGSPANTNLVDTLIVTNLTATNIVASNVTVNYNYVGTNNVGSETITNNITYKIGSFGGPTNVLDMSVARQQYTATSDMAITNFTGRPATGFEEGVVLTVTNSTALNKVMYFTSSITSDDGARSYTITNQSARVFSVRVADTGANVVSRQMY